MADIFVSYARADKARVAPLVAALEAQGWSVWWDPEINPGQEFDSLISSELKEARAVIVVWTPASVSSRWVRGEARVGADRGILVPVRFDNAELPIDARSLHTTDLDLWDERSDSAEFGNLVRALGTLLTSARETGANPAQGDPDTISIAVLPFVNLSSDPEQEYFSDGLTEELMNQLAQLKELRVIGRTSCFAFKGKNEDLRAIGQKLGVAHILEGSVRKAGKRLRITAQLIECADHHHLWSHTYDRDLDDVFAIQDDVARAVADALKVTLGMNQSTLVPGGTTNVEAYDLLLRAQAQARAESVQGLQRARTLLLEAVELDPRFAIAWARLGGICIYTAMFTTDDETIEDLRRRADEAFERAKASAPGLWMTDLLRAVQAFSGRRDWLAAQAAFDRASELSPSNSFQPAALAVFFGAVGRIGESIDGMQRLVRSDPLASNAALPLILDCAGRYEEAEAEYKRQLTLPADPILLENYALLRIMTREGSQTAKLQLKRFIALSDSKAAYVPFYTEVLAKFDDRKAALAHIRKALDEPVNRNTAMVVHLAYFAAYFGDEELALACLRLGFIEKRGLQQVVLWHPVFAEMRKSEGFKQLVRDLGLYDYWRGSGHWGDYARPLGDDDFEIVR